MLSLINKMSWHHRKTTTIFIRENTRFREFEIFTVRSEVFFLLILRVKSWMKRYNVWEIYMTQLRRIYKKWSNNDETSNFVDVTKVKVDAEKAIATKEKTKRKKKDKKSTILRAKKIKTIKKIATSNRKRKRAKISDDEKRKKNDVSSKSSTNDSDKNNMRV